jgi:sialate O-acetylesterase
MEQSLNQALTKENENTELIFKSPQQGDLGGLYLQMKKILILSILILSSVLVQAIIKLPALVGDNMVLQRDAKINLWGWAAPGEKIGLQFQNTHTSTNTGKDGKWTITLQAMPAGGPYDMVIKGKNNSLSIRNILIGDVWLASGQSNMEWITKNIKNSKAEIAKANIPRIRLLKLKTNVSFKPQQDFNSDGWVECSPKSITQFSAIAYLFGRELYEKYQVPVGLINSSWGGTPAEAWISSEGLSKVDDFKEGAKNLLALDSAKYAVFNKKREDWYKGPGAIDRGHLANGQSWADTGIDTSDWLSMELPCLWSDRKQMKGYYGAVWFCKEIVIPPNLAGKPLELNMTSIASIDSTFFNGKFVGYGAGFNHEAKYTVSGDLVKAGKNLITVRIIGSTFMSGFMGIADDFFAQSGDVKIPLSGEWRYKPASNLKDIPNIVGLVGYNNTMPQSPNVVFNAMIAPLIPYTIKGVIWYQGEGNAYNFEKAKQYYELFPTLIGDWRKHWGTEFPFIFVQLAGFQENKVEPADYPWARVREAQSKALSLPFTGMATAIDIGEQKSIHPKNKQDIAHRLVLVAEKIAYGEQVVSSGPTFNKMIVEGDKIRIKFNNTGSGLLIKDESGNVRGFAIAGANRKFAWAKAYQDGNDIIIIVDNKIKQPIAIRYGWSNFPDGNIYNKENLPAIPFRTDDW